MFKLFKRLIKMADQAKQNATYVDANLEVEDCPLLKRDVAKELDDKKEKPEFTDAEIRQFLRTSGGTRTERWAEAEAKAREARELERSRNSGNSKQNS